VTGSVSLTETCG